MFPRVYTHGYTLSLLWSCNQYYNPSFSCLSRRSLNGEGGFMLDYFGEPSTKLLYSICCKVKHQPPTSSFLSSLHYDIHCREQEDSCFFIFSHGFTPGATKMSPRQPSLFETTARQAGAITTIASNHYSINLIITIYRFEIKEMTTLFWIPLLLF